MTTQAEQPVSPAETAASADESLLADAFGNLVLASIGAVSLAGEKTENLLRHLVARGEADVQKARRMLGDLRARRPRLPRPSRPVVAIGTGNLASKADMQALEQRLDALAAQIESLNKGASEGL